MGAAGTARTRCKCGTAHTPENFVSMDLSRAPGHEFTGNGAQGLLLLRSPVWPSVCLAGLSRRPDRGRPPHRYPALMLRKIIGVILKKTGEFAELCSSRNSRRRRGRGSWCAW